MGWERRASAAPGFEGACGMRRTKGEHRPNRLGRRAVRLFERAIRIRGLFELV